MGTLLCRGAYIRDSAGVASALGSWMRLLKVFTQPTWVTACGNRRGPAETADGAAQVTVGIVSHVEASVGRSKVGQLGLAVRVMKEN